MVLDSVVVPFLEGNNLKFTREDNVVLAKFHMNGTKFALYVVDKSDSGFLKIVVSDLVTFPESDGYVPYLLSDLNSSNFGKWVFDEGDIDYVIDLAPDDSFSEAAFERYFNIAVATALRMKEVLMQVRYGGKSLEAARATTDDSQREPRRDDTAKRLMDEALSDAD